MLKKTKAGKTFLGVFILTCLVLFYSLNIGGVRRINAQTINSTDVSAHNTVSDCWLIINNKVYNLTGFLSLHSGGSSAISPYCGKDATAVFTGRHLAASYLSVLAAYYIGDIGTPTPTPTPSPSPSPTLSPTPSPSPVPVPVPGNFGQAEYTAAVKSANEKFVLAVKSANKDYNLTVKNARIVLKNALSKAKNSTERKIAKKAFNETVKSAWELRRSTIKNAGKERNNSIKAALEKLKAQQKIIKKYSDDEDEDDDDDDNDKD